MKRINIEIDDDGSILTRTHDSITNKDRLSIIKYLIEHMDD